MAWAINIGGVVPCALYPPVVHFSLSRLLWGHKTLLKNLQYKRRKKTKETT